MADNNTIARPYAQAVFELSHAREDLGAWSEALAVAGALLSDGRVVEFLGNPALDDAKRLQFLTGLFAAGGGGLLSGNDQQGSNFLKLLLENGRLGVLPEIAGHFERLKAQIENTVDVTVISAVALSAERRSAISAALKARLGRDINLETQIDENLIGGAVIKAGDVVIDGSVRARLDGLTNALVN